jgi:hypothetical protein
MKNLKIVATTFLFVILCFTMVLFTACEKDATKNSTINLQSCNNVICLNGGACSEGACNCAVGYEGLKCETRWSDKFIGNYQAQDECYAGTNTPYYSVSMSSVVDYANKIRIYNLGTNCTAQNILATINPEKTSFTIPLQNTCGNIWYTGTGNISLQEINIYLIARDTVTHTSKPCSILLHKL